MIIRAFRFMADGQLDVYETFPAAEQWDDPGSSSIWWIDLEAPDDETLADLAIRLNLDSSTVEDLRSDSRRARIDEFDEYCLLIVYGVLGISPEDEHHPRQLAAICRPNCVITVHDEPINAVQSLVELAPRIASRISSTGADRLLFLLLDKMVDNIMLLAREYEESLEKLEDRSVEIDCEDDLLQDLAEVRRNVLDLWRISLAQREVLIELCEDELDFLSSDSRRRLDHVRDHMSAALEIVEILRGMVGDVRENYRTTISLRGAEATKKLTIFAGLLLPVSVIAGIYGMNVPLWPDPAQPSSFWVILAGMAVTLVSFAIYFRREKWM